MTETRGGEGSQTGVGTAPRSVPPDVSRLASARGFGALLSVRHAASPSYAASVGWGVAAVIFGALIVVGLELTKSSANSWAYTVLHSVGIGFLCLAVLGIGYGVRGLVTGSQAHYLYTGGVVHMSRSGPRAIAWPDVARLKSVYQRSDQANAGNVVGYRLETSGGTAFTIPLIVVDGRDAFIDQVVAAVHEQGRPIV